jgi:hypothetical protein
MQTRLALGTDDYEYAFDCGDVCVVVVDERQVSLSLKAGDWIELGSGPDDSEGFYAVFAILPIGEPKASRLALVLSDREAMSAPCDLRAVY